MADYYDDDFQFEEEDNNKGKNNKDLFENFEDKNVKKKESFNEIGYNNKSIGKFGNSSPRKKVAEDDEYADDFDNEDIKKNKSKSKSKNKDKNKKHQNLPRNKTTKNMSKNNVDQSRAKGIPQSPFKKYSEDVETMFPKIEEVKIYRAERIVKLNERIRETIKSYSEHLDNLISKKIHEFNRNKNTRKLQLPEQINLMKEQIKNNEKIEERLNNEYEFWRNKEQKYKKSEGTDENQNSEDVLSRIKNLEREIYSMKLNIDADSKKLSNNIPFTDRDLPHISQEVTIKKKVILKAEKEYERNEEKINQLQERQYDLSEKVKELQQKDKQADRIKQEQQKKFLKNKKYADVRKRLQNARNHSNKTVSLWQTKGKVIEHENQHLKMKLKNMDLQVRNLEDSINIAFQKSIKTMEKARQTQSNPNTLKGLEKIKDSMKVYQAQGSSIQREMSKSQFSKMPNRKSIASIETATKKGSTHISLDNDKNSTENTKYERVWKDDEKQKKQEYQNQFMETEKTTKVEQREKEEPQKEEVVEEKKKPFSLKKNRASSEQKFQPTTRIEQQKLEESKNKIEEEKKEEQVEKPIVAPKRFQMRNRSDKKEDGYNPSNLGQNKKQESEGTNTKPTFTLKRRNQGGQQNMQNQFVGTSNNNSNPYAPKGI